MLKTSTQKKSFLRPVVNYVLVLIMLALFSSHIASAQAVLVAGTEFNPTSPVAGKTYYGIIDVAQYGMITGNISVTPPFTPSANANVFNGSPNYAITTNPANLDAVRYEALPAATDYMLVASSPASTPANLLTYTVPGLVPGSNVSAVVTYCYVISSAPYPSGCSTGDILSLRGVLNADANNTLNGLEGTQVHAGGCYTLTITQATSNSMVVPSNGTATFNLNFQQSGACKAVGVSKIEITGVPQPAFTSSEGSTACTGEQTILQPKQQYDPAATYQWQVNTGSGFGNIGGATNSAYLLTVGPSGTAYQYQLKVTYGGNTYTTAPVTVNSITCCTAGGSRQTVYYDDFGTLDLAADPTGNTYKVWDYTNPKVPVQVTKSTSTSGGVAYRWTLASPPVGTTFASSGPVGDGQYTVAAGITGYNNFGSYVGSRMQWAGDVGGFTTQPDPSYDHSGDFSGAAMFLNVPAHTQNQVIYSRNISGLCPTKQAFFECWINVFTSSAPGTYHPVNIAVKLTDITTGTSSIANATATRQADGGGYWVEITGSLTMGASSTTMKMEIINNQDDDANGDDLVLDDIRVLSCSPPSINMAFNTTTLAQTTTVCTSTMDLFSLYPASLSTYYGGAPNFLYQYTYTPNDYTSWKNYAGPIAANSTSMTSPKTNSVFTGVPAGTNVYFRVIAATAATFSGKGSPPFTGVGGAANYASQTDVCQAYSVSDPISASVLCPLPVNMVSFVGVNNGSSNQLSWITSSEKDNSYFLVERSTNGTDFIVIGRVEGNGTRNSISAYNFKDNKPLEGVSYYRLKQVDLNGDFVYSKTISILDEELEVTIYPNPNDGSFHVGVKAESKSYKLDITDLQGKNVYSLAGTEVPENIQVNNLSEGIYILRLYIDNEVITRKLVVY